MFIGPLVLCFCCKNYNILYENDQVVLVLPGSQRFSIVLRDSISVRISVHLSMKNRNSLSMPQDGLMSVSGRELLTKKLPGLQRSDLT